MKYIEVDTQNYDITYVDPDIPAWGPRGDIKEYATTQELYEDLLSYHKAGFDIAIPDFHEWRKQMKNQ